jgi:predicted ester cyclase
MTDGAREQAQERAIRQMTEAFNTGNTRLVDELVEDTDDLEKTPLPGASRDKLGLKLKIRHLRSAFPNGRFTIEEMQTEGDTVTFRWRMEGTHRGHFLEKAPTNKNVTFTGQDVVKFRDGKMIEHTSLDNKGGLLDRRALE